MAGGEFHIDTYLSAQYIPCVIPQDVIEPDGISLEASCNLRVKIREQGKIQGFGSMRRAWIIGAFVAKPLTLRTGFKNSPAVLPWHGFCSL
jgi:hypothetical protein